MKHDTAFQMAAANIRFGHGITREIGMDLTDMGSRRTMLVIDPVLVDTPVGETVIESLKKHRVNYEVFDSYLSLVEYN